MPAPIPVGLGRPVTTRNFSLEEMVSRAWGSEFKAPDHGVYEFSNLRRFDSTDMGRTGIYRPDLESTWTADNSTFTASSILYMADGYVVEIQ